MDAPTARSGPEKTPTNATQATSSARGPMQQFLEWFFSVKVLLLAFSILQVVISAAIVCYLWWIYANDNVTSTLETTMERLSDRIQQHIEIYANNASAIVLQNEAAFYYDAFNFTNIGQTATLFSLEMESIGGIRAVYVGTEEDVFIGSFTNSFNTTDSKYLVGLRVEQYTGDSLCLYPYINRTFTEPVGDPIANYSAYYPTQRPWYNGSVSLLDEFLTDEREIYWTDLYLYSTGELGISAAVPVVDPLSHHVTAVFASDITLVNISSFLQELDFSESSVIFILDRTTQAFVATSAPDQPVVSVAEDGTVQFVLVSDRRNTRVKQVLDYFDDHFDHGIMSVTKNRYEQIGDVLVRVDVEGTFQGWIIVVSAEREDFTQEIDQSTVRTIVISIVFAIIVAIVSIVVTRWITSPLIDLSAELDSLSRFEFSNKTMKRSSLAEIRDIQDVMATMKVGLQSFEKYVPSELVRSLLSQNREARLGMDAGYVTCFFADIEDFSGIAGSLPLADLVDMLGTFFEEATELTIQKSGTVDKYIGDAIMAFWNAPVTCPGHQLLACETALSLLSTFTQLQKGWRARGYPHIRVRMGMHCGDVLVGNVGSRDRLNYTVLGDTVNLATRIEHLNKRYETSIIISAEMEQHVRSRFLCRPLDIIAVKGRDEATEIYELVAETVGASPADIEFVEDVSQAYTVMKQFRFENARDLFLRARDRHSRTLDKSIMILIERCNTLIANPPQDQTLQALSIQLNEK